MYKFQYTSDILWFDFVMFDFPQKTSVAWQRDGHYSRPLQKRRFSINITSKAEYYISNCVISGPGNLRSS